MKVLFPLEAFYPSTLGGTAQTMYWLGKSLVDNGCEVTVVTSNKKLPEGYSPINKWTNSDGINVRYCSVHSKLPLRLLWNSLLSLKGIDAVVLSSIFFMPNFFIALFSVLLNKRVIWSPRGELFDTAIEGRKTKVLFIKLLKVLFSRKVVFHVTSQAEKKVLVRHFGEKSEIYCIPNYFEIPDLLENESEEKRYFMFLGRIAPIKALDKLLLALSQSKSFTHSDIHFYFVGVKEVQFENYYDSLQNMVRDLNLKNRVSFVGPLQGIEKYKFYSKARFSFLISESENFGNVVIEALSQGTPVVCSFGTPWEILEKTQAGFWTSNNPSELSKTINTICELDDVKYKRMRRNARQLAVQYDISQNIDKWINVLNNYNSNVGI